MQTEPVLRVFKSISLALTCTFIVGATSIYAQEAAVDTQSGISADASTEIDINTIDISTKDELATESARTAAISSARENLEASGQLVAAAAHRAREQVRENAEDAGIKEVRGAVGAAVSAAVKAEAHATMQESVRSDIQSTVGKKVKEEVRGDVRRSAVAGIL